MKIKVHLVIWIVLLAVGFLLGFVPQYREKEELQTRLQDPQKVIDALKLEVQMGELRDLAGQMLLELSRQNYGLARDFAAQYYRKLKEAVDSTSDGKLKSGLQELLATQESLTTSLDTATASSLATAQPIVTRTYAITKTTK